MRGKVLAIFGTPMRYAGIAFNSIFNPSRVAPIITFGSSSSLRRAVTFWFAITAVAAAINSLVQYAAGFEVDYSLFPGGDAIALLNKHEFTRSILQALYFVVYCLIWYALLILFVGRGRLPFLGFVQCSAYPTASFGLLGFAIFLTSWSTAPELYQIMSKTFVLPRFISEHRTSIPWSIDDLNECSRTILEPEKIRECRLRLVAEMQRHSFAWLYLPSYLIPIFIALNTSTLVKFKTGIRRRLLLGVPGAALAVVALGYLGFVMWLIGIGPLELPEFFRAVRDMKTG